jgi:hypothetical protein
VVDSVEVTDLFEYTDKCGDSHYIIIIIQYIIILPAFISMLFYVDRTKNTGLYSITSKSRLEPGHIVYGCM